MTADGLAEKQFEDNKSQGKKYKWTTKFENDRSLNAVQQHLVGTYDREKIGYEPDEIQAGTAFGPRHSAKMEILYEAAKTQRLYKVEDTARRSGGGVQTWAITPTAPRQVYLVCYGCKILGPPADSICEETMGSRICRTCEISWDESTYQEWEKREASFQ